jgi:hypothetical protein
VEGNFWASNADNATNRKAHGTNSNGLERGMMSFLYRTGTGGRVCTAGEADATWKAGGGISATWTPAHGDFGFPPTAAAFHSQVIDLWRHPAMLSGPEAGDQPEGTCVEGTIRRPDEIHESNYQVGKSGLCKAGKAPGRAGGGRRTQGDERTAAVPGRLPLPAVRLSADLADAAGGPGVARISGAQAEA